MIAPGGPQTTYHQHHYTKYADSFTRAMVASLFYGATACQEIAAPSQPKPNRIYIVAVCFVNIESSGNGLFVRLALHYYGETVNDPH